MYTAEELQRDAQKGLAKECLVAVVGVISLLFGLMHSFLAFLASDPHDRYWLVIMTIILLVCAMTGLCTGIPGLCTARDKLRHVNELRLSVYDDVNNIRAGLAMELETNSRSYPNWFNDTPPSV